MMHHTGEFDTLFSHAGFFHQHSAEKSSGSFFQHPPILDCSCKQQTLIKSEVSSPMVILVVSVVIVMRVLRADCSVEHIDEKQSRTGQSLALQFLLHATLFQW